MFILFRKIPMFQVLKQSVCGWIIAAVVSSSTAHAMLFGYTGEDVEEKARLQAFGYPQVCLIKGESDQGTGMLIKKDDTYLYVLTAAHCVNHQEGEVNAIFTHEDGRTFTCPGILAFSPDFGPQNFVNHTLNKDISILKCFIPPSCDFDIEPFSLTPHVSPEGLNRYEGQFIGYGRYGVNGDTELKMGVQRRLGKTNLIEYRQGNTWVIMTVLKAVDDRIESFKFLDWGRSDPPKLDTQARYMLAPLTLDQKGNLDYSPHHIKAHYPAFSPSFKEYLPQKDEQGNDFVFLEIHPEQARIMPGDSGGPLFLKTPDGKTTLSGIIISQTGNLVERDGVGYKPFYLDQYTPVAYFKDWINAILEGAMPEKTIQHVFSPNPRLGVFRFNTLSFVLSLGLRGQVNPSFGLYVPQSEEPSAGSIQYSPETKTLSVNSSTFHISRYKNFEDLKADMMASNQFTEINFHVDQEQPTEVLVSAFNEALKLFLLRKSFYAADAFKTGLSRFKQRHDELKTKADASSFKLQEPPIT